MKLFVGNVPVENDTGIRSQVVLSVIEPVTTKDVLYPTLPR